MFLQLPLRPVGTHYPKSLKKFENHPERLSLVFEPEAAAAWCKQLDENGVSTIGDTTRPYTTEGCFLTVDVGGGTIDVTAHQVEKDGKMKMHNRLHGRVHGGTVVNEAFRTFLAKNVFHDENYRKYLVSRTREVELFELVYAKFEDTKKIFAGDSDQKLGSIEIRESFTITYQSQLNVLKNPISKGADLQYMTSVGMLRLSARIMETFFSSSLENILKCIDETIASVGVKVEMMYLVGGFGGCPYIAKHIRTHYDGRIKVFVPQDHELAVVRGACVFHSQGVLRTADATYGVDCSITFDEDNPVHLMGEKITNSEGKVNCSQLFCPYVQIGDVLDPAFVYLTVFTPFDVKDTSARFDLYSIKEAYTHFVKEKNGQITKGMRHLGHVEIDYSKGMHLPLCDREIEIFFDFSSVEILTYARFIYNKDKDPIICKVSTDFLSTLEKVEKI